jgi:hypothetical protein
MIAWFSKIKCISKTILYCSVGDGARMAKKRKITKYKLETNVEIIPHLNFEDLVVKSKFFWMFFLYQIHLNSYFSIDGTMQAAMLFSKPIVIMVQNT